MRKVLFAYDGYIYENEFGSLFGVHVNEAIKKRYLNLGDQVTFLMRKKTIDKSKGGKFSKINESDFSFIEVPNFKSIRKFFNNIKSAKRIIIRAVRNSDIIVARLPSAIGRIAIAEARRINKPHLAEFVGCTYDAYWNYNWKGKLIAYYKFRQMQNVVKNLPYVIYVTEEFLQRRYPSQGKQIACSNVELNEIIESDLIDRLNKIDRLNVKELVLATVAAIDVPYKGQDDVIKAIGFLNNHMGWNLKYVIIGQGDPSRLNQIAQRLDAYKYVEFSGSIKHAKIFHKLREIDLYIQPSKTEGLPRALIEAMSVACPALGARTAGIPELLTNECIFDPGSVTQIIEYISRVKTSWMREQAIRNHEKSFCYKKSQLEIRRQGFYKQFLEDHGFN